MKAITQILLLAIFVSQANAQRVCGDQAYMQHLLSSNPSAAQSINNAERQMKNATAPNRPSGAERDTATNELINIPVVIHVLYNNATQNISDAQILSQLEVLNNDFSNKNADRVNTPLAFTSFVADSRIKFCLAQLDPQNRRTTGIIRKNTSISLFAADDAMKSNERGGSTGWDSKKYLNIWVCTLEGRSLGYATPPGSPTELDGVVIAYDVFGTTANTRAPFNKGRTATHEVGHWLGLKHLWGDTNCGDDGVDDTPRQRSYNFGCPSFPRVTTCSPNADGDMFMDFMDFSDDACMNMFTQGQKKRMRSLFATGNARNSFLVSFACDSTLVQSGPTNGGGTAPVVTPAAVEAVNVYPNPTHSTFTIDIKATTTIETKTIQIYNSVGVCVYKGQVSQQKTSISIANFPAGVYTFQLGENSNRITKKIVKL